MSEQKRAPDFNWEVDRFLEALDDKRQDCDMSTAEFLDELREQLGEDVADWYQEWIG